jgi:hypothetical protein
LQQSDFNFVEVLGNSEDGNPNFWRKASASYKGSLSRDTISERFVRDTLRKSEDIVLETNHNSKNGVNLSKVLGTVILKWTGDNQTNTITSEFHVVLSNDTDYDIIFGRQSIIQQNLPGHGLSNPMILKATNWIHATR